MTTYTTITSKGQITLPAEARRALNLRPGQKVAVRVEGDHLVIDPPQDIAALRKRLREEAEAAGTWGTVPQSGDGWGARAEELGGSVGRWRRSEDVLDG
ncbi:AbrB/MazE/SpoVT family DNA-binding domain-containing protein [Tessaracoccus caeni]|uniref:AbrB/MazE/SpoVT family DNA-binding domain-containing protein n=1 Tax=Tessaracoccus caeni TaxID=3031239 RepID=UPI0023DA1C19|nr:AbrB/MazE/SpoVT family DNA-binding domain-containing protein [Tessaracoccus caeni]MDF1489913.1 AbrB/MazE/SpoVT family DNA-binding domain-containing protein [Tessaracoccus caeni]